MQPTQRWWGWLLPFSRVLLSRAVEPLHDLADVIRAADGDRALLPLPREGGTKSQRRHFHTVVDQCRDVTASSTQPATAGAM